MTRAPSRFSAALRIADLSLATMLWSRRTVFMALVVGGPVAIALVARLIAGTVVSVRLGLEQEIERHQLAIDGPALFGMMIWLFYLRFIVPVLAVFYGTGLIADEVEDKTITYLVTRPIGRGAVLLGKYLAYLACTTLVVLPSVVLVYLLVVPIRGSLGATFPALVTDLGLLGLGLAVYGALFALAGAGLKRPLLVGLVFVLGWEPGVLVLPGYLKHLTIAHYMQSLAPHAMPQDSALRLLQAAFTDVPSVGASLACLAVLWVACLWAGVQLIERREFVLEQ